MRETARKVGDLRFLEGDRRISVDYELKSEFLGSFFRLARWALRNQ